METNLISRNIFLALLCLSLSLPQLVLAQEKNTLPPLSGDSAPADFESMWSGFDPRAEPLEIETLKEWQQDGVVLRIVRFRIGVFKGQKSKLAAIYGYPKNDVAGGKKLPGLLQIHGGGQYASFNTVLTNAKRGYATVSIAWAGRIDAPDYKVNPAAVKLFWDDKTEDPNYKLTTDWGAVDGYHAPCRNARNNFPRVEPDDWTIDAIESPRNSPWFLCSLAARRALTFLEKQPEVNADKLGVYGHSMGGKLTVMTASDPRVKAAAPSCGGISDRDNKSEIFRKTIGDGVSLQQITCPIMFLSPANDFHGRIGDLPQSIKEIGDANWRLTCAPHHNHQDIAKHEVTTQLWFDQHLKRKFKYPQTPVAQLNFEPNMSPTVSIKADSSRKIQSVDVFYTQQGKETETNKDRNNTVSRFWYHAKATGSGDDWNATLPIESAEQPLWVYVNVEYDMSKPVSGAGYYHRDYTTKTFVLSSLIEKLTPARLQENRVGAELKPTNMIEEFGVDWEKQWYSYKDDWRVSTHKVYSDLHKAPADAELHFRVHARAKNLLLVEIDRYVAEIELTASDDWQDVQLTKADFKNFDGESLPTWDGISTLTFNDTFHLKGKEKGQRKLVGRRWKGNPPRFLSMKWVVAGEAAADSVSQTRNEDKSSRRDYNSIAILDLFPESTVGLGADKLGRTTVTSNFTKNETVWADGLIEQNVFQAQMTHEQDPDNSYSLRIGKGGQIYSLRGSFGESVPPSFRELKGTKRSPWNDEVWQFVAVCSKYNGTEKIEKSDAYPAGLAEKLEASPYANSFFIHNSGAYIEDDLEIKSLYCPMLASHADQSSGTYQILNWGLVPQIKTMHRSPVLYYTQVRDAGDGVIELTWVVHNFSVRDDIVFDHLNAPWGGTRVSSLPYRYVVLPDGECVDRESILTDIGCVGVRKTSGFNLSCVSEDEDSPALALVYGRDKHLEAEKKKKAEGQAYCQTGGAIYRDWRARNPDYKRKWSDWASRPVSSFRNYDVVEFIPKLKIDPGKTIWFRSYLVVGNKTDVTKKASELVDHVDYGLMNFDPADTPMVEVVNKFRAFTRPVEGSMPLFLIQNENTKQNIVTTDPYFFVTKEDLDFGIPDDVPELSYYADMKGYSLDQHNSNWKSLLGYGYKEKPAGENWKQLSQLFDQKTFPAANQYHLDLWVDVSGIQAN